MHTARKSEAAALPDEVPQEVGARPGQRAVQTPQAPNYYNQLNMPAHSYGDFTS